MTTPKHTPEPWEISETTDPTADIDFVITHPLDALHKFCKNVCLVYGGDHAEANAALISLSPRLARVLKQLLAITRLPQDRLADYAKDIAEVSGEADEILKELEKAGAL